MQDLSGEPDGEWIEGLALDDPALADNVLTLCQDAARVASESGDPVALPRDLQTATAMLEAASARVVAALEAGDRAATPRLLVAIGTALGAVRDHASRTRAQALVRVQAAVGRLRGVGSVDELVELAPSELCRCGFDRVLISRVDGGRVRPQVVHIPADPDWAFELQEIVQDMRVDLDGSTAETEMLRRPGPILVAEAWRDPRVIREVVDAMEVRSYVAAPIVPQGTVVAFVHADALMSRRVLGDFDRELIGTFAQGFSSAWERALLLERLRLLRQDVRRGHSSVLAVMDDFADARVEIGVGDPGDRAVVSSAAAMLVGGDTRLEDLLTRRELDVMHLMAAGETNARIAKTLVVSEGTVKSHVKHILRKLRAKNRAEAVSRFAALSRR